MEDRLKRSIRSVALIAIALLSPSAARAEMDAADRAFMQQDYARARRELDKATLERNPDGYILLGLMNRDGQGGAVDLPEAYFDITLGLMNSNPSSWSMGLQERGKATAKMTRQQILSAEQRAGKAGRKGLSDAEFKQKITEIRDDLRACSRNCEKITGRAARFGPAAKNLIPELEALMTRDEMWMPRTEYAYTLGIIGTEAVPALVRIALDRQQLEAEGTWNLQTALEVLGKMGAVAAPARPALLTIMTGSYDISKAQFNDLYSGLTGRPPETMLTEAKLAAALALARIGDPGHEVYAQVIEYRDHGRDPVGRLVGAAAAAMTYGENEPLVQAMAFALQNGTPAAQELTFQLLSGFLTDPATKSGGETLRPAVRRIAEISADPSVRKAARAALEDFAFETRLSASEALRSSNYKQAIEKANAALDINPWSEEALRIRADARRASGDVEGAVSDFRKGAEQGDALAQYELGLIYSTGIGVPPDSVQAYTWLALAILLGNDDAKARQLQISQGMTSDQTAQAERLTREWLRLHSQDFPLVANKESDRLSDEGSKADGEGQTDKAIDLYSMALEVKSDRADVLRKRSVAYEELGKFDQALADISRAISLAPSDPDMYQLRGDIHVKMGALEDSIADYSRSLSIRPAAGTYAKRGAANAKAGKIEDAIADYEYAVALAPDVDNYGSLAGLYIRKGDFTTAIEVCGRAWKINEKYERCFQIRSSAELSLGRTEEAIADLRNLAVINPQAFQAHSGLGRIDFMAGRYEEAISEFEIAVRTNPEDPYDAMWIELARRRAGKPSQLQEAVPQLKISGWPEPLIQLLLGDTDLDSVRSHISNSDEACELGFYGGEWLLAQGKTDQAHALLSEAARTCPPNSMELQTAITELDALTSLDKGANYEDAMASYERGHYATATRMLRPLAETGDPRAQNSLGFMYASGKGTPQDYAEAVKWYRKAADQGIAEAQYAVLASIYDHGKGVPQDYAEAVKWYRKAAEQGYAKAQLNLGLMYDNGKGVSAGLCRGCEVVPQGCRTGLCQGSTQPWPHVR